MDEDPHVPGKPEGKQHAGLLRSVGRGMGLGALTGMALAAIYALITISLLSAAAALGSLSSSSGLVALPVVGGVFFCGAPLAFALGILPGALLGALGGGLTGLIVGVLPPLPRRLRFLPGALVGAAFALGWALFASGGFLDDYTAGRSTLLPLFFWVAGPGLLLVAGLGWVSLRLADRVSL